MPRKKDAKTRRRKTRTSRLLSPFVAVPLLFVLSSFPPSCSGSVVPCRPPHPLVSQRHPAPRAPRLALLALRYADWPGPTIDDAVLRSWFDGAPVEYLRRVSGGCTSVTFATFVASVPETERKGDGTCRTQPDDTEALTLPELPTGFPADFDGVVVVPVGAECTTSASSGRLTLNVGGEAVELPRAIFMGKRWRSPWTSTSSRSEEPIGNPVFVHELLHLFGAGYHSNAKACNDPGRQQTDLTACPSLEYGDLFDVLGSASGLAPNLNARVRYDFGWLGGDDLAVVRTRGTHQLSPVESRNDGKAAAFPVAAVLPRLGLWVEWRGGHDAAAPSKILEDNPGFFVRRWADLVDADLHTCEKDAFGYHNYGFKDNEERIRTTLLPGRTLLFRSQGTILQADPGGVDVVHNVMTLHVHYTGAAPPCFRSAPHISTGMIGEWRFCTPSFSSRCDFADDPGLEDLRRSYSRITWHVLNGMDDGDSPGCGDGSRTAVFDLAPASPLPAGWAFASRRVSSTTFQGCKDASLCQGPGWSPIGGGFAFGIPDAAPDGDYDVCIAGTKRDSGLVAAEILRISLPEEDNEWWTNNRPASYANVDPGLKALCAALDGSCAEGRTCNLPLENNCVVDLVCPDDDTDPSRSGWGRCWAGEDGTGRRWRGQNIDRVTQSVCRGGPPLLESETCAPALPPPCQDQATCTVPSDEWTRLYTEEGDGTGICGRCDAQGNCRGSWTNLCKPEEKGFGEPVCNHTSMGGNGYLDPWTHPCFRDGNTGKRISVHNETCVRDLCTSSDLCGGYMATEDRTKVYLYPADISRPTHANPTNPHQCWRRPAEGDPACTCIGGPVVPSEGCTRHGFHNLEQWTGPTCNTTEPSPAPSSAPSIDPVACADEKDFRFDRKPNKKFSCAKYTKNKTNQKCRRWDSYGRLVRNHCPDSCGYCPDDGRCEDQPRFKIKIKVKNKNKKYKCKDVAAGKFRCDDLDKKGRMVAENCRGSCSFCG